MKSLLKSNRIFLQRLIVTLAFIGFSLPAAAQAPRRHWVATWGTAQQILQTGPTPPRPPQTPPPPINLAVPTAVGSISNQTIRMVVRVSLGGQRIRVRLANAFGNKAVTFGAARIALHTQAGAIDESSDRPLTFGGKSEFSLGPGVVMLSDPLDFNLKPLAELAVSLYVKSEAAVPATHLFGLHQAFLSSGGDFTNANKLNDATTSLSYYWLAGIEVLADSKAETIVTLGDSITDGHGSMPDSNHDWPSLLAERLQRNPRTAHFGVVNAGISGNQVMRDGGGVLGGMSALARLERDVLTQPGARWITLMEGINDITSRSRQNPDADDVETIKQDLIAAYRQIIARAHTHGIKVIGCTLTPFGNSRAYSEKGEKVRQAINEWIKKGGEFDALADFDQATRDETQPTRFRVAFHAGDWLHPGNAGYEAMANAIYTSIFAKGIAK